MMWGSRLLAIAMIAMAVTATAAQAHYTIGQRAMNAPGRSVTAVVNQDQLQGIWKQFKGELKKQWAEFTDDDLLAIEGSVDKLEGKIQERYGDRREEVKRWVDEWFDRNGVRPSES